MVNTIHGIRAVQLYELISAPLVAILQADARAARTTLEFIQEVGFHPSPTVEGEKGVEGQATQLRMAEFGYRKLNENNEVSDFVASVPVLSLVPIPIIQIKEARVSLSAQIVDINGQTEEEGDSDNQVKARSTGIAQPFLEKRQRVFLAKPVASSASQSQETKGAFHLDIELSLGQADVPMGMEKIFNLMDQAIQDRQVPVNKDEGDETS